MVAEGNKKYTSGTVTMVVWKGRGSSSCRELEETLGVSIVGGNWREGRIEAGTEERADGPCQKTGKDGEFRFAGIAVCLIMWIFKVGAEN